MYTPGWEAGRPSVTLKDEGMLADGVIEWMGQCFEDDRPQRDKNKAGVE